MVVKQTIELFEDERSWIFYNLFQCTPNTEKRMRADYFSIAVMAAVALVRSGLITAVRSMLDKSTAHAQDGHGDPNCYNIFESNH